MRTAWGQSVRVCCLLIKAVRAESERLRLAPQQVGSRNLQTTLIFRRVPSIVHRSSQVDCVPYQLSSGWASILYHWLCTRERQFLNKRVVTKHCRYVSVFSLLISLLPWSTWMNTSDLPKRMHSDKWKQYECSWVMSREPSNPFDISSSDRNEPSQLRKETQMMHLTFIQHAAGVQSGTEFKCLLLFNWCWRQFYPFSVHFYLSCSL